MTFKCQFKTKEEAQERANYYKGEGLKVHSIAKVLAPNLRNIVWEIEVDCYPIGRRYHRCGSTLVLGMEESELEAEWEKL